jgi:hypothetical protein
MLANLWFHPIQYEIAYIDRKRRRTRIQWITFHLAAPSLLVFSYSDTQRIPSLLQAVMRTKVLSILRTTSIPFRYLSVIVRCGCAGD